METQYKSRLIKIEDSLKNNLPKDANKLWIDQSFSNIPLAIKQKHFSELINPCRSLLTLGGKRWRPLLLVLCSEMISGKSEDSNCSKTAYTLVPLVEFVHTASLIHDDIEDNADTRRGQPAVHYTYGIDAAINAGSWLYFEAFSIINTIEDPTLQNNLYKALSTEIRRLHLGQAMDIAWHNDDTTIPTPEEYTAMVRMKTGTLASLAARIGTLAGNGTESEADTVASICANIGVGFQILDDYINLTTGNKGKKRGDDIVEGKKSLPVLFHLHENPSDKDKISNCFTRAKKEGADSPAVEECIKIISSGSALEKAKTVGTDLILNSCTQLKEMYPAEDKTNIAPSYLIEKYFLNMVKLI
ncbi:MAG: polyprenyl synthetase [Treponema sp. CETP13]|nr:MAG: polyprenyl synthetase [Treponema sp. CETP13]